MLGSFLFVVGFYVTKAYIDERWGLPEGLNDALNAAMEDAWAP